MQVPIFSSKHPSFYDLKHFLHTPETHVFGTLTNNILYSGIEESQTFAYLNSTHTLQ